MVILPSELCEKIYYLYIPLYQEKMKEIHKQLLKEEPFLTMTDNIFDFDIDFYFAERLPPLLPSSS